MIAWSKNYYSDIRLEDVFETKIIYRDGKLQEKRVRKEKGAFLRVYDGKRWYYSSSTELTKLQEEMEKLYKMADENMQVYESDIVKKLEVNKGNYLKYVDEKVSNIDIEDKDRLLKSFFEALKKAKYLKTWSGTYIDNITEKHITSSKGTDVVFDMQRCGVKISLTFANGENTFSDSFQIGEEYFNDIEKSVSKLDEFIKRAEEFLIESKTC